MRGRQEQTAAPDTAAQRAIVDAFLAAARGGELTDLLAILHPDVVLRADAGRGPLGPSIAVRGARAVAEQASRYTAMARFAVPAMVNGAPGLVAAPGGRVAVVLAVRTREGQIVALDILADPQRLDRLGLVVP